MEACKGGKCAPSDKVEVRGVDAFNVFQHIPAFTLKSLGCSRKGDWVEWRVSESASAGIMVCVSCRPFEVGGFNGGKLTDIGITVEA